MATLSGLHPEVAQRAQWALEWARFYGVPVQLTSGFRTRAEQQRLYNAWISGRNRFPANRPGTSSHEFGLAFDAWVPPHEEAWFTALREWLGFRVPAGDVVHAEVPGWRGFVGL